ncbi:MAG TPA: ABC-2 family transporter protein [Anaerolineaceae bacterium]|nr:ABC-2 family transporter protein [Anaerolineaceae bacterium]HPN50297.1 ABC-2 family transporter protein [Anaerolineaceae bacterium]
MRLFLKILRLSFRRQLTYRTATLAGLVTNLFFGVLRASVLIALFNAQPSVNGLTVKGAVTFAGLTQGVIAYLSIFGWWDIMQSIEKGSIGADLLKPMNFFTYWLAQDIGRAAAQFVTRGLVLMIAFGFLFQITLPASPAQWLAFAFALILSGLVSFAWRFIINLAAFWSPNAIGFGRFAFSLTWIFSGFAMPLRLFPDWFQQFCAFTPFPAMINTVIEIFLGTLTPPETLQALLLQAAWFVGLSILSQFILKAGIRRLVIQGG